MMAGFSLTTLDCNKTKVAASCSLEANQSPPFSIFVVGEVNRSLVILSLQIWCSLKWTRNKFHQWHVAFNNVALLIATTLSTSSYLTYFPTLPPKGKKSRNAGGNNDKKKRLKKGSCRASFLFFFDFDSRLLLAAAIMVDDNTDLKDEVAELAPFDPTKKKKKKKVVIQENADEPVDSLAEKTESLSVSDGLESSFTGLKKKKKKPVETSLLEEETGDAVEEDLDGKKFLF
ncbi:hypothetical protein DKX38_020328 [Salix brachista]|uniref:Uncharacterized protein n=1 Tax=Salix brachista TaxID=2182728 RepID=A0A5N5KIU4_9ROSI|nr:hypothetical protein DKX38_020328 [Salix brachista]